ncbi:hypothetical protein A1O7_06308 [Cladophialophora yegresii CBS 114405]|uniref:Bacteriorhodopsin n=1 Tax=Cladophialophora yegresii CBS 114405 TaxID=1182544 RepID=W9VTK4_9EURO|nr:uncharacterized protein A1O7_06308 [Cladophialophora yegresii CBS 114405]EXJ58878.1 hypothetical protein A1O7_06308 [Cladophialophora yegresii CBS 114405]
MEPNQLHPLFKRNNNAVSSNPTQNGKSAAIALTSHGSDFYYAIMSVMGVVGLGVIIAGHLKPQRHRIFYYITAAINLTAMLAYYAMGSHQGWAPINVEYQRSWSKVAGVNREIYYARYIDWFITTPLLLLDLMLTAGLPWPTIVWTIFIDWIMIITGLIGALTPSRWKWGWWTFGTVAMFYIFWNLAGVGRKRAKLLGQDIYRTYMLCGVLTLFVWLCYPIAWGVSEGANIIAPDSEAVFYGVLDFLAKPVFSVALIAGHWNIDPARLGLDINYGEDRVLRKEEKAARDAPVVAGNTGVTA